MDLETIPGVELDIENSTITLAGHRFPCGIFHDAYEPGTMWGGLEPSRGWAVDIPLENGACVQVRIGAEDIGNAGPLSMHLYLQCPYWVRETVFSGERPCVQGACTISKIDGVSTIVPWISIYPDGRFVPGPWHWEDCEPEWAAEHIHRLAVMPFLRPEGLPRMQWVRLADDEKFREILEGR